LRPPDDDRPPLWLQTLAAVSVLVLAVVAISGWYLNDRAIESANRRTDDVANRLMEATVRLATLEGRAAALEKGQLGVTDTAETVSVASPSVFRVSTPFGDGSAWVARSEGGRSQLVTNYHVLHDTYAAGGRTVQVVQDARSFEGTVVAVAETEDLALVEVAAVLPVLPLAATGARVGDSVLVFGSPLGFDHTVTAGVISAFRNDLIQFDANISPGSSGGPVVDRFGDVIGVTVQKIVEEGAEGIGFAIPVATLCVTVLTC
jgi:putative serine protease PepD